MFSYSLWRPYTVMCVQVLDVLTKYCPALSISSIIPLRWKCFALYCRDDKQSYCLDKNIKMNLLLATILILDRVGILVQNTTLENRHRPPPYFLLPRKRPRNREGERVGEWGWKRRPAAYPGARFWRASNRPACLSARDRRSLQAAATPPICSEFWTSRSLALNPSRS